MKQVKSKRWNNWRGEIKIILTLKDGIIWEGKLSF